MTRREIENAGRDLHDGPPRLRRERAELWGPALRADVDAQRQRVEQVVRDYREALELRTGFEATTNDLPHVDAEARRKAFWVRCGGLAVLAIETVLAVGLSIWSLTLWPVVAGVIGALMALGWTAGSLGLHYGFVDTTRPEQATESAKHGARISFVIGLVGFVPLLLARTVASVAVLTGVATAVISLGFSSLAAYLFLLAFLIGWAVPYAEGYERLQGEIAQTKLLAREATEIAEGRFPLRPGSAPTVTREEVTR